MTNQPQIELLSVNKHYGGFHALKDINVTIPKGSFVALVGPSGCGKSTLLRSLAGLESISGGEIRITGKAVNDTPPRHRDVAMVFQSYALYPHMSVRDNMSYSMRLRKAPRAEIDAAVADVAAILGLGDYLDRKPNALSGGQRQRVAMGRAIIRNPKVFLFDEPLSNLDAALRVHMRKEIRALHDRIGATSVYVTHDQIEAMTMADHVVVLKSGVVEQQGAPLSLYDTPATKFVAGFIGSPAMNFVGGIVADTGRAVTLDLPGAPSLPLARTMEPRRKVDVGLRPEHLSIETGDAPGIETTATSVESTGSVTYLYCGGSPEIVVVLSERERISQGEPVRLTIAPDKIHLFDPETGAALR
ncbi:ABC transporter ATP-binding protein [uncultured Roseibium sp.]|uniref:ABC transporter ATP-binding protein n=1 Tax=uncultured Roseibium sp. TaxID=1936171 RepID=UPI0026173254|nr:sn-glycerol-3-phosphate ABC transporter ATP-binding protein UgpC [uncultured Roseibium sp.]